MSDKTHKLSSGEEEHGTKTAFHAYCTECGKEMESPFCKKCGGEVKIAFPYTCGKCEDTWFEVAGRYLRSDRRSHEEHGFYRTMNRRQGITWIYEGDNFCPNCGAGEEHSRPYEPLPTPEVNKPWWQLKLW